MLSRAHFPSVHTNCFVLPAIFLAPDQDDRGKYVRQNFPLRPSFTPSNPPRKSQRLWQRAASFAVERRKEEFEKSFKMLRIKRKGLAGGEIQTRFQHGFRRKTNRALSRYRASQWRYKFDSSLIAAIQSFSYEYI